jgi:hypothetical protein
MDDLLITKSELETAIHAVDNIFNHRIACYE